MVPIGAPLVARTDVPRPPRLGASTGWRRTGGVIYDGWIEHDPANAELALNRAAGGRGDEPRGGAPPRRRETARPRERGSDHAVARRPGDRAAERLTEAPATGGPAAVAARPSPGRAAARDPPHREPRRPAVVADRCPWSAAGPPDDNHVGPKGGAVRRRGRAPARGGRPRRRDHPDDRPRHPPHHRRLQRRPHRHCPRHRDRRARKPRRPPSQRPRDRGPREPSPPGRSRTRPAASPRGSPSTPRPRPPISTSRRNTVRRPAWPAGRSRPPHIPEEENHMSERTVQRVGAKVVVRAIDNAGCTMRALTVTSKLRLQGSALAAALARPDVQSALIDVSWRTVAGHVTGVSVVRRARAPAHRGARHRHRRGGRGRGGLAGQRRRPRPGPRGAHAREAAAHAPRLEERREVRPGCRGSAHEAVAGGPGDAERTRTCLTTSSTTRPRCSTSTSSTSPSQPLCPCRPTLDVHGAAHASPGQSSPTGRRPLIAATRDAI